MKDRLKKPSTDNVETLERVKRWDGIYEKWMLRRVRIWCGERCGYWRPNQAGYTDKVTEAEIYTFTHAYVLTRNCGPEKRIDFILVIP